METDINAIHPVVYLTKLVQLDVLAWDVLGHHGLEAGVAPSNPGPHRATSQCVALLTTRLVWTGQNSSEAPHFGVTPHLTWNFVDNETAYLIKPLLK